MKKFNNEVYYADEQLVKVNGSLIDDFKKSVEKIESNKIRLCVHKDPNDLIHEMFIVHTKDTYVRPHKHIGKVESLYIIEGWADAILFKEDGSISETIKMGDYNSGLCFYYRLSEPLYHTLLIKSDIIVFHEVTKGPFCRDDTVFPKWAPDAKDKDKVICYIKTLGEQNERHHF